jgi:hypothetical protein
VELHFVYTRVGQHCLRIVAAWTTSLNFLCKIRERRGNTQKRASDRQEAAEVVEMKISSPLPFLRKIVERTQSRIASLLSSRSQRSEKSTIMISVRTRFNPKSACLQLHRRLDPNILGNCCGSVQQRRTVRMIFGHQSRLFPNCE